MGVKSNPKKSNINKLLTFSYDKIHLFVEKTKRILYYSYMKLRKRFSSKRITIEGLPSNNDIKYVFEMTKKAKYQYNNSKKDIPVKLDIKIEKR